jgi:hypothetical protein
MSEGQALQLIKEVCAAFVGNLQQHENIQQAIKVIEEGLIPKAELNE